MMRPISKIYFLPLVLLTISLPAIADDSPPTAQDINNAAQKAKQVSDAFFTQTFNIRMQYEYSGRFLAPQDKDSLCKAAQQASADLEQIANTQLVMKRTIESYQKDDWETLFGQTGLWRKLAADLIKTTLARLEIQYYLALGFDQPGQTDILHQIITQLDTLQNPTNSPYWHLLKAKSFTLLATTDPTYRPLAKKQLDDVLARTDIHCSARFRAELEMIKLLGPRKPDNLSELPGQIAQTDCKSDREITLTLACLQHKYLPDSLPDSLAQYPQTAMQLGELILNDLSSQLESSTLEPNLASINPADAELAATVALSSPGSLRQAPGVSNLITRLADSDRFQTPAVAYLSATLFRQTDIKKTVRLLIKASDLQLKHPNVLLNKTPEEMAEQAYDLSYQQFTENSNDCQPAITAFENYSRIAPANISEQTQFLYGTLLLDCNKTQDASETFARLANDSNTIWHDKASLELLKIKINTDPEKVLPQLRNFILNCADQEEQKRLLRLEAMDIYCRTILGSDINDSAAQVLNLLDTAQQTPGLRYDLFKAQALRQLGRLEESARYMSKAVIEDSNSSAILAAQIASEIINKIELWQKDANDFNELLRNCSTLADFAHKSANTPQTNLLFAEMSILQGKTFLTPFSPDENDVTWLRVQARILMAQEKFEQAAKLWAKIGELRRNETPDQPQKTWGWWQARFYELDCLAKSPSADKQNIAHAIDVLCGSYPQIPAPWAEKLDILKRHCSAN